ncbi:hypothetical protein PCH_Pc22g22310 [Penicillium rubens Wisconsin 54-1255]|uniref:Uncharacterized protein n=1 Tax=Penicillium rubens (strain ATCC 28089 / DSM 1075 / NRRL 1951 / Wisconsin 54-1255) TaxID=500485 RepID=B6HU69_PENRW|nr:hypothetical protein PCH_Pc22g22310 [Penicillium rubens Wisconsin 54-1255]
MWRGWQSQLGDYPGRFLLKDHPKISWRAWAIGIKREVRFVLDNPVFSAFCQGRCDVFCELGCVARGLVASRLLSRSGRWKVRMMFGLDIGAIFGHLVEWMVCHG